MLAPRIWFTAWLAASLLLWAEVGEAAFSLHGFIQGNYELDTASSNPDGRDSKLAEERAQLKLEADQGPLRLFVKTDLAWDLKRSTGREYVICVSFATKFRRFATKFRRIV